MKRRGADKHMATDPVCGMHIDEKTSSIKSKVSGKEFYFCCPSCKARFDKDPSKFSFQHL